MSFVACGPEHDNLFEQLAHWWPDRRPPDYAEVVSPFFDVHDGPNRPASTLWKLLRHRGKATVTWHVSATRLSDDGPIVLHAPESLRSAMPKQRPGVATHFAHINEATKTDAGKDLNRPLHAKMISLFNTRWRLLLIGSSNFTSAGTGIANTPNVEANLVYWANQERESEAAKLIDQSILRGENADFGYTWQFDPRNEEQQEDHIAVGLPEFFEFAEFYFIQGKGYLRLRLGKVTPGDFLIYRPDSKEILYSFDDWQRANKPTEAIIFWTHEQPPQGVEVFLPELTQLLWWPVNVEHEKTLRPIEELRNLPLELLMHILTSTRPLREAMRTHLTHRKMVKNQNNLQDTSELLDPHQRVDTTEFILQRTRRLSWALSGLCRRLSRPAATINALHWRLYGPVGANALATALLRESNDMDECLFVLSELILELHRLEPDYMQNCLPPDQVRTEINKFIKTLEPKIKRLKPKASRFISEYSGEVLAHVLRSSKGA